MNETVKRTITLFLLFFFLAFLYVYGNNIAFLSFIYILSIFSFYEWISIGSKHIALLPIFIILISLFHYINVINIFYLSILTLIVWIILIYSMIVISDKVKIFLKKNFTSIGFFIFTSFFLILINMFPISNTLHYDNNLVDHKLYILFLVTLLSSIDIFAYISGKAFGKNKITISISPNKTLEGFIGSYFLTVLIFILLSTAIELVWTYLDLFYLTIFILLAFFGDLFMSFVKRIYNIKDTGNILPGHGGVLDRLDSYFPSLPLFYLWFMI